MEFNTVTISDGITMGTQGMKASLSRARSSPTPSNSSRAATLFDGLVGIAGCDKNMPGIIMALCRLDIPGLMLYGGSIAPGKLNQPDGAAKTSPSQNVFEGIGAHAAGKINDASSKHSKPQPAPAPAPAAASSPPTPWPWPASSSASRPCSSPASPPCRQRKHAASREAGRMVMELARKPSARRRSSPANRSRTPSPRRATGGSTNAVLHLIAIAHEIGSNSPSTTSTPSPSARPSSAISRPGGKYVATDYQDAGGSRLLAKRLHRRGHADGPLTVSGKNARRRSRARRRNTRPGRHQHLGQAAQADRRPRHPQGQSRARRLRDEGRRPPSASSIAGTARVFDCEEDCFAAVEDGKIKPGDVLVIRYEGPKGGPGMREMLQSPPPSTASRLSDTVALFTDGRFSGATRGLTAGHVAPEHSSAAPSPRCAKATPSPSTSRTAHSTLEITARGDGRASQELQSPGSALQRVFRKYVSTANQRLAGRNDVGQL